MVSNNNEKKPLIRILAVEDNEHDRVAFTRTFKKVQNTYDFEITEFVRAEEALENLSNSDSQYDIVVSDYKLPGISGLEFCLGLMKNGISIPIVILTGTGSEQVAVQAIKAGIDDYIVKDPEQGYLKLLPVVIPEVIRKFDNNKARLDAEKSLRESEKKFREILENSHDTHYRQRFTKGKIDYMSPSACRLFGYTSEELFDMDIEDLKKLVHSEDLPRLLDLKKDLLQADIDGEIFLELEFRILRKSGEVRWINANYSLTHDDAEQPEFILGVLRDITGRKEAEQKIKTSLKEKEVLLKEIHHRVKNNMQIIVSLLMIHSRKINDAKLGHVFDDCCNRINAMTLIHEALYQSDNLSRIDFKVYLKKLCSNLSQAHNIPGKDITIEVKECNISLDIDQSIAVGMIASELVSNAFKHAFTEGNGGVISVKLTAIGEDDAELIIEDSGKGLPPEVDILNSPSLGLQLTAAAVTRELDGSIEVEREGGTRYIIRFKCKHE